VLYAYAIFAHIEGYPFRNGIDCGKTYIPFGIHANMIIRIFTHLSPPDLIKKGRKNEKFQKRVGIRVGNPYWKVAI
jgi:hypothetical protein